MSGLRPIAAEQRTSPEVRVVPTGDIRATIKRPSSYVGLVPIYKMAGRKSRLIGFRKYTALCGNDAVATGVLCEVKRYVDPGQNVAG
jgi:hypothetical protein